MKIFNDQKLNQIQQIFQAFDCGMISLVDSLDIEGKIYFKKGRLLHAEFGGLKGYSALAEMLLMDKAFVRVENQKESKYITINEPLERVVRKLMNYDKKMEKNRGNSKIKTKPLNISYQLQIMSGAEDGKGVCLNQSSLILGRTEECDIVVSDDAISRQHCRFFYFEGVLMVEDLKSSNGTYLNGFSIGCPSELNTGDKVRMGETVVEVQAKLKRAICIDKPKPYRERTESYQTKLKEKTRKLISYIDQTRKILN